MRYFGNIVPSMLLEKHGNPLQHLLPLASLFGLTLGPPNPLPLPFPNLLPSS